MMAWIREAKTLDESRELTRAMENLENNRREELAAAGRIRWTGIVDWGVTREWDSGTD